MNLEHVKHNFTCEISHVKNHMFQIHMFNFTHVKSCGIFVRVVKRDNMVCTENGYLL